MRKNNCELIRRELDELMLDETYSSSAVEHLRECADCRDFHDRQTKLRQIVSSLGTVAAPADFDFRLRARLANEASAASQFHYWPVARRALAVAALLIVFATGAVLVKNVVNRPSGSGEVARKEEPKVDQPDKPVGTVTPIVQEHRDKNLIAVNPEKHPQIKNDRSTAMSSLNRRQMVSVDRSGLGAEVIKQSDLLSASPAFPIDVSDQAFKVSLDDGRGNAKTISVPPISFGSQKIVQSANQLAPKRAW